MEVLKQVLNKVKPSEQEKQQVLARINSFIKEINKGLKHAEIILGGSGAKDTWLKGTFDADLFVKFDYNKYKDRNEQLSNILEKHLKKNQIKFDRLHGSRDYFQIQDKDFTFEIVPILGIKKAEQALNITDVSPLHADWVNKKGKKIKDEIRLTKAFLKANKCYGAESYIQGFSGYVAEVLTIHYKSFIKLLRAVSRWKDKEIIDPEHYYKNKNQLLFELNKSKKQSPLIIIDPVQKDRNAAAALSQEKYNQLIKTAKLFLKTPNTGFFEKQEITQELLKKKAGKNKLTIITPIPKTGKRDIVGAKLMRSFEYLKKNIERKGFTLINSGWTWDEKQKAKFWFISENKLLPEYEERIGPPKHSKENFKRFKHKYKNNYIKGNRIYAKVKREFRDINKFIKAAIKDEWFKDKIKGFRLK